MMLFYVSMGSIILRAAIFVYICCKLFPFRHQVQKLEISYFPFGNYQFPSPVERGIRSRLSRAGLGLILGFGLNFSRQRSWLETKTWFIARWKLRIAVHCLSLCICSVHIWLQFGCLLFLIDSDCC